MLLSDLSEFLLAIRTGSLDGGPRLNALHAKGMPTVDYGLLLFEFLVAHNALKDLLLARINTLLLLFLVMFVGKVLCRLLFASDLIIGSLFGCSVFNEASLSLRSCRLRMLIFSNPGGAPRFLLARVRQR
jgi:hypothetical protein